MHRFRPRRSFRLVGLLSLAAVSAAGVFAQFYGGGQIFVPPGVRTARALGTRSVGTPQWENPKGFQADVFTFARLRYDAAPRPPGSRRGGWTTDLPDADLNLSYRLQQLTSMKVDPDCRLVRVT